MSLQFNRANFMTSAAELKQCPPDEGVEVAFCGRSNAGKSSAINALSRQKSLARTSKTPGRTQLINFFSLNDTTRLVDLPGYGYAKVPTAVKHHWQQYLDEYLRNRKSLKGLVLLVDIRHGLKEFDEMMINLSQTVDIPLHILLTKADKFKQECRDFVINHLKPNYWAVYRPKKSRISYKNADKLIQNTIARYGILNFQDTSLDEIYYTVEEDRYRKSMHMNMIMKGNNINRLQLALAMKRNDKEFYLEPISSERAIAIYVNKHIAKRGINLGI